MESLSRLLMELFSEVKTPIKKEIDEIYKKNIANNTDIRNAMEEIETYYKNKSKIADNELLKLLNLRKKELENDKELVSGLVIGVLTGVIASIIYGCIDTYLKNQDNFSLIGQVEASGSIIISIIVIVILFLLLIIVFHKRREKFWFKEALEFYEEKLIDKEINGIYKQYENNKQP